MKALILAGGVPQAELIEQLKHRGIETILLDGSENAVAVPFADKFYKTDIFDVNAVKKIAVDEKVDFVLSVCADQVLLVVAQVSEILGLPCYVDYETARRASDKIEMKRVFVENNIPTSQFAELEKLDFDKIAHLRFPLVVKPVDAYSSKGVRKVTNTEELERYYAEAAKISRSGGVIIEEFCEGQEISVDAFVINGKAHLLCVSNSEKIKDADRFVIFRGRYPAAVSQDILKQIETVTQQIADAFHLVNSPLLVQMINDGRNVSVLEFCTRTGGNIKYLLIKYSSGVDVIKATIDVTLGQLPNISLKDTGHKYVVNDFVYCRQGIYDHIEGFDEMVSQGIIEEYHCMRVKGWQFSDVRSSSDRIAGVTMTADSIVEFNQKHKIFVDSVKVISSDCEDIMRHDLLTELKEL